MLTLSVKIRKDLGKKVKKIREKGMLPAILYGPKIENVPLEVDLKEFEKVYQEAGESSLIQISVGQKKFLVLIHSVEIDAISQKPTHIDFYQPKLDEEITATIPLVFEGEASAVKSLGGTLVKNIHELEVKALPQNLPHEIKVDINKLETFEDNVLIKDLIVPKEVKILKEPDETVAFVAEPEKIAEELEKPVEEKVAEVEKVAEKKKEEEEEEKKETKKSKMKISNLLKPILLIFLILVLIWPNFSVISQEDCQTREECEALLKKYEEEIKKLEGAIGKTEQEQRTIQNQIRILKSTIQKLDLQIQQGNIVIKDLSYQIKDTKGSIEQTSLKIEDLRSKLAAILQIIYEEDQTSIIEILLSGATLSDFFDNLMALETLNLKNQEFLGEIKNLKETLERQKQSLDAEKGDLERIVRIQYSQKQQSQAARNEQKYFLRLTKAQKQQYLKEKEAAEKIAAEIRERIFRLIGIPDIEAPTFEQALQIAGAVTRVVNIRPAFLLGVISAESALGRNVGQCYITNSQTGGGVFIRNRNPISRIMHPTRDLPIFLRITGDNFSKIPVSCWIPICQSTATRRFVYSPNVSIDKTGNIICPAGYVPFGWGGAMGPAQFIPSTWLLYERKITSLFGVSNPNPWNVYDSFAASALYLYELGAGQKTLAAERNAAHRYSGGYSWYASDVMRRASCIQDFIDKGTMSSACQQLIF